ncbi:hypothetical protein B566_EDAN006003, partial [Ephemera danica]
MMLGDETPMATTVNGTPSSNSTDPGMHVEDEPFCKWVLYVEIGNSRVRVWDLVILVPNLLFLLLLAARFNRARLKLRATSSPIFLTFYGLVVLNVVLGVLRCAVSMTVNAAVTAGDIADKVLWIATRFFLLATEMSVLTFGLAFGHLDSRSSIRHVLLATALLAFAFSATQAALELLADPEPSFHVVSRNYDLFRHGGMAFWATSSALFALLYLIILTLPCSGCVRDRVALPTKRSFYVYCLCLLWLDLAQTGGSTAVALGYDDGLCVLDLTTALYFSFLAPLVYHTFLSDFFGVSQPSLLFSYKAQVDDTMEDDTVSLPHQQSFSSLKTDSDYIYQNA